MKKRKNQVAEMDNGVKQQIVTDPFGMYTGIPEDSEERPIQDADDL